MCFSAEASFGASAVITTIGVVAYKKADHAPHRLLAMIPIFFGIQQFAEGMVWMASKYEQVSGLLSISTYTFIFFAWIVWPIFIPFSLWKLEENPTRKKGLSVLMYIGVIVALILVYVMLFQGVQAEIQDCSIAYNFDVKQHSLNWLFSVFYLMVTVLSTLITSIGRMWMVGVLNLLMYLITRVYFAEHMISVWCFFAAITSGLILWIIVQLNEEQKMV